MTYWHRWTFWAPAFLSGHDVTCMSDCSPPSPDKYINTWTKAERKEREKEGSPTTVQGYLLKTLFLHSGQNTKCSDKPAILYRFVHGTVHLLYCINTHTLITVLPYTFIFFNYWVNPTWWRINPQCTVLLISQHFCIWLFCAAYSSPPRTYMIGGREERKREGEILLYSTQYTTIL